MIDSCQFSGNHANDLGGAIRFIQAGEATVSNCDLLSNTADLDGGGVYMTSSTALFEICLFKGNSSPFGAGLYISGSSEVELRDSIMTENVASSYGGGMSCLAGSLVDVIGCVVSGNTAIGRGGGIDIDNAGTDVSMLNTTVCGNQFEQIHGTYTDQGGNTVEEFCTDTDGDGVPDGVDNCDLYNPDQADCNGNGLGDVCDIADQNSFDCDQDGVPDECENDCDGDGLIDDCESDPDFDQDGLPDNCETGLQ